MNISPQYNNIKSYPLDNYQNTPRTIFEGLYKAPPNMESFKIKYEVH